MTLLGTTRVVDAAGLDITPRIRKSRAVLAVLALAAPKRVLRDQFAGLLWSQRDRDQGRASLRQCVHELQSLLAGFDSSLFFADRNHLALDSQRITTDVRSGTLSALPLLADLDGLDPMFDRWLTTERQRFGRAAMAVAEAALVHRTHPPVDAAVAIAAAEHLLAVDPVNEAGWRVLIAAQLARGDRANAMETYQRCVAVLAERANIGPAPQTQALVASTFSAAIAPSPEPVVLPAKVVGRSRGARLAVRPFRSLDGTARDPLARALAEEITTALSRFRWLLLIVSPLLSEAGDDPGAEAGTWQDLGLDFLLDGTIQRSGATVRVSVRLLDLHAGPEVLWAARFDHAADDLLSLQDQIAAATVAQIDPAVLLREGRRAAEVPQGQGSAYSLTMTAIPAIYRLEEASFRAAGLALAEAIRLDPEYAAAHTWFACWHLFLVGQNWAEDTAQAMEDAARLASRAVALDPSDARALTIAGHVTAFLHGRIGEASRLHERALELNPSLPLAWAFASLADCYAGRHEAAIARVNQGRNLSPYDPHGFFFDMALMLAHLLRHEFEPAVILGRQAVAMNPQFTSAYKIMLSALGHLGRTAEAAPLAARLMALEPGFTVTHTVARTPLQQPEDLALYAEGLRRAGLPQ